MSPLLPDGDLSKDEREALFARYIGVAKAFKTSGAHHHEAALRTVKIWKLDFKGSANTLNTKNH